MCPCGTGKKYDDCCGIFISNQKLPSTPEELMRSRYTAYSLANIDYIAKTMKSPAADNFDVNDAKEWAKKINWIKLDVIKAEFDSTKGMVEFIAYYLFDGQQNTLHETSEFRCDDGKWFYVDGVIG